MIYRPEIDGLRAVAVVPVILFHAGVGAFAGGFVGVDVFFVISGFLITSILLADLEAGRFDLGEFYRRRARRILPALAVVTLACIPVAWMLLLPRDMTSFLRSLIGVATFSANFVFWREDGYFDIDSEEKPLLHTWSLAVEEQFYILFPLALLLAWRLGRGWVWALLAGAGLVSLLLAEWAVRAAPAAAFYLLPTRAWELMLGAAAAVVARSRPPPRAGPASQVLSLAGLAGIALAVALYDAETPFPGIPALLPTAATVLVILHAVPGTLAHRLLSAPAVVGVGLISYSLYLWHQPLFAFARYALFEIDAAAVAVLVAATFGLAIPTWRYVEQPIRRAPVSGLRTAAAAAACGAAVAIVGAVGLDQEGFNQRAWILDRDRMIDSAALGRERDVFADTHCAAPEDSGCRFLDKRILFVGDSMWKDALNILWSRRQFDYDVSWMGGCPPTPRIGALFPDHPRLEACEALNAARFRQDLSDFDAVVVVAQYGWFRPADLRDYLEYLRAAEVDRVLVMGGYYGLADRMDRLMNRYGDAVLRDMAVLQPYIANAGYDEAEFRALQREFGFAFLSVRAAACGAEGCRLAHEGLPFTFDEHHFTLAFGKLVAERNGAVIEAFLGGPDG